MAAVGADEAWAVGAAGTVVHVKGTAVERFGLPTGAWLRAVWASGPDDVWFGGDDATLVHFDGKGFHRLELREIRPGATLTAIGGPDRDHLWAVGPSGLLRLTRRP